MLLSRFWYVVLAALASASIAAGMLARTAFNRQHDIELADRLTRDRREVDLLLKEDARARLDAIAPIAAHPDVRAVLSAQSPSPELRERATKSLAGLNVQLREMRGDLLFLLDATGRGRGITVQNTIAGTQPAGASGSGFGEFPVVERVLAGYVRDDVWVYNGGVFRIAARPVIDGGRYAGAVVHGKRIDNNLAERLGRALGGAGVVFFRNERILAAHFSPLEEAAHTVTARVPTEPRDDLALVLPTVVADADVRRGRSAGPLEVGVAARGVFSLVTGTAAYAGVGYGIVRPVEHITSATDVFDRVTNEDVGQLPWAFILVVFAVAVALAMFFVWLERDRPIKRLKTATGSVAEGTIERLSLAEVGGLYRTLAAEVNRAIEKAAEVGSSDAAKKKAANLDEILGPTPVSQAATPFFSFGPAPAAASGPATAPKPAVASKPPAAKPGPRTAPPPPPPPPVPPPSSAAVPTPPRSERPRPVDDDDEAEEINTTVAEVPDELLEASSKADRASESRHHCDVYEKFIETRKSGGEAVEGLTFEKFVRTLERNRDQILSKHPGTTVRFAVYVKDGKAALRATPLR